MKFDLEARKKKREEEFEKNASRLRRTFAILPVKVKDGSYRWMEYVYYRYAIEEFYDAYNLRYEVWRRKYISEEDVVSKTNQLKGKK